uniref:Myb-like domain-containing protein n=1 Tax=Timema shepardi TaxID=629360 RepID=A0A7R9AMX9_TIMSH|nr:unnamed protein product [Timema shepardi]
MDVSEVNRSSTIRIASGSGRMKDDLTSDYRLYIGLHGYIQTPLSYKPEFLISGSPRFRGCNKRPTPLPPVLSHPLVFVGLEMGAEGQGDSSWENLRPLKGLGLYIGEDTLLKQLVEEFNERWEMISGHFPDRSDVQCQQRWQKVVNPELVKGPWTKEVSNHYSSPPSPT